MSATELSRPAARQLSPAEEGLVPEMNPIQPLSSHSVTATPINSSPKITGVSDLTLQQLWQQHRYLILLFLSSVVLFFLFFASSRPGASNRELDEYRDWKRRHLEEHRLRDNDDRETEATMRELAELEEKRMGMMHPLVAGSNIENELFRPLPHISEGRASYLQQQRERRLPRRDELDDPRPRSHADLHAELASHERDLSALRSRWEKMQQQNSAAGRRTRPPLTGIDGMPLPSNTVEIVFPEDHSEREKDTQSALSFLDEHPSPSAYPKRRRDGGDDHEHEDHEHEHEHDHRESRRKKRRGGDDEHDHEHDHEDRSSSARRNKRRPRRDEYDTRSKEDILEAAEFIIHHPVGQLDLSAAPRQEVEPLFSEDSFDHLIPGGATSPDSGEEGVEMESLPGHSPVTHKQGEAWTANNLLKPKPLAPLDQKSQIEPALAEEQAPPAPAQQTDARTSVRPSSQASHTDARTPAPSVVATPKLSSIPRSDEIAKHAASVAAVRAQAAAVASKNTAPPGPAAGNILGRKQRENAAAAQANPQPDDLDLQTTAVVTEEEAVITPAAPSAP